MEEKIYELVDLAREKSELINTYAEHVEQRTAAMQNQFISLSNDLIKNWEHNQQLHDLSSKKLQEKLLAYIDTEIAHVAAFDAARKKEGAPWLHFQISSHKLSFVLSKIREQLVGEENESRVLSLVSGYFRPDKTFKDRYPLLRTDSFFGSNTATYEAYKLFCATFAFTDLYIDHFKSSSLAHVTNSDHLPECWINSGSKFCGKAGGPGFGFPHAGYAFGGHRDENEQREFGPQDCSSLLFRLIGETTKRKNSHLKPILMSTQHQLFAWRYRQYNDYMQINYSKDDYSASVRQYGDSIFATETPNIETVAPGDIYFKRTAIKSNTPFDLHSNGGGHTGAVIGHDLVDPNKVLIFECARSLEDEKIDPENRANSIWGTGGAGIGSVNGIYEENTETKETRNMFLRLKY